jgi:hypothetical protein
VLLRGKSLFLYCSRYVYQVSTDLRMVDMLMQELLSISYMGYHRLRWAGSLLPLSPPEDAEMGPLTTHV